MFITAIKKEFILVFRDLHSVLVLFAMPVVFIVIMSLAMEKELSSGEFHLNVKFSSSNTDETSAMFLAELSKNDFLKLESERIDDPKGYFSHNSSIENNLQAIIVLSKSYAEDIASADIDKPLVDLWLAPSVDSRTKGILIATLKDVFVSVMLSVQLSEASPEYSETLSKLKKGAYLSAKYAYGINQEDKKTEAPSAVQQSVPAWLIFSMFFVVIPLSTTLVTERQQGTLMRLRTMNFPLNLFLIAKLVPYLLINQVQLILMLVVGRYLIPLLGGEYLIIGESYGALMIMSFAVGFSAVGYALLIAVLVKTTEQATSVGGVGNILLGAIGGIMVPKFVMPEYLQAFTNISPMAWGLEGFLDIFLRSQGVSGVLAEAGWLLLFGMTLLGMAFVIFHRQTAK